MARNKRERESTPAKQHQGKAGATKAQQDIPVNVTIVSDKSVPLDKCCSLADTENRRLEMLEHNQTTIIQATKITPLE
jgi:hypothetical protein